MNEVAGTYSSRASGVNDDYSYNPSPEYKSGKSTLGMQDYFKLLAAQLSYQDMSNPMSNSEMMAQLTEMAMVEAMNTSTQTTITTYASGMLNKEATVAEFDEVTGEMTGKVTGIVEGVNLAGGSPTIFVDGKEYALSQLMSLGKVPEKADDTEEPGDTEKPGDTGEPGGTESPGGTGEPGGTESPGGAENSDGPADTGKSGETGTPGDNQNGPQDNGGAGETGAPGDRV